MTPASPDRILQLVTGFMAAKHLFVATEVGLFAHLATGPATLEDLADRLGLPRRSVRILAAAMVALGLVEQQGDHYSNSAVATTYLSGPGPTDLRPLVRHLNQNSYPRWHQLEESIRTGQAAHGYIGHMSTAQNELFAAGVEAITAGPAQALASQYAWASHRRVLDLGGGTGSFLLAILARYPAVHATLLELAPAAAVATVRLHAAVAAGQATIQVGDFFHDPIPTGHDAVIIANVLHLFSPARNKELLTRTRAAVRGGTPLLLVDFWTDVTHTQPPFTALMAGEFLLASGEGDVYSVEDVQSWLATTGWGFVEHRALSGPASLIIGEAVD